MLLRAFGVCLSTAFLLLYCAGRTSPDSSRATGDSTRSVGGARNALDECAGAAPDGGCDGIAGEGALEPYARLRTACSLNVRVNRRGAPVCVDPHIR